MKKPLLTLLPILALAATLASCGTRAPQATGDGLDGLDALLERSLTDWSVPGIAVGVIRGDTVALAKGYGAARLGDATTPAAPMTDSTIFGVASLTKAFTAMAVGMEQKAGRLDINQPIIKTLPWFATADDSLTRTLTLADAMSHRTGLRSFGGDLGWYGSAKNRGEAAQALRHARIDRQRTGTFGYSNLMFLVAGMAVEQSSGMEYESYVEERILRPLGMLGAGFGLERFAADANCAMPHIITGTQARAAAFVDWRNMAPAGGLFATLRDMLRWVRFQWSPDYTLVDSSYVAMQQSIQTPQPPSTIESFEGTLFGDGGHGFGWKTISYNGHKMLMHNGSLEGMTSQLVVFPELKSAAVILANATTSLPVILGYELAHRLTSATPSPYYDAGLTFRDTTVEQRQATASATAPGVDLRGEYFDNLMGPATITTSLANGTPQQLKIDFALTPVFSTTATYTDDGWVLLWENMPSLPLGKLTVDKEVNGKAQSFTIECDNPDFLFDEVRFTRK